MFTRTINQPVSVTSVYFGGRRFEAYPKRIEFDGTTYTFRDGVQCMIKKGQDVVRVFTMTDGTSRYRLRFATDAWTLLNITPLG